jgi:MYXO-CTERM domain-containing protein
MPASSGGGCSVEPSVESITGAGPSASAGSVLLGASLLLGRRRRRTR